MARQIYVDESGVSGALHCRTHARSLRGKRVFGSVSGKITARTNVVAGYCDGRIMGEYCYKGSATAKIFEDWFCKFLLPETRYGDVIILDNASFHNKKRLKEYAAVYKVTVIFLPASYKVLNETREFSEDTRFLM